MAKQGPKRRAAVSPADKERMMIVLIRNTDVFLRVRTQLQPAEFGPADGMYAMLWRLVGLYYDEHGVLPTRDDCMRIVSTELHDHPGILTDAEVDELEAMVDTAYDTEAFEVDIATEEGAARWAVRTLKRYLHECLTYRIQNVREHGLVVSDLTPYFQEYYERSQEIDAISDQLTVGDDILYPENWDVGADLKIRSTGMGFLDHLLDGGHAPGEAYGLLGPYGSCKTTLGIAIAVEGAFDANNLAESPDYDGVPTYSFLFSWEAPKLEMQIRVMTYAAQVERKALQAMGKKGGLKSLSTRKTKKPYEIALNFGEDHPGEQGRCKRAMKVLNKRLICVDMTGSDPNTRTQGEGFIDEIVSIIQAKLRARGGGKVGVVVLDYVGIMAKRYMARVNKDEAMLRHFISGAVIQARNKIAIRFGCPVWLLHQLSAKANELPPGAKLNHTDAAEAKNIAENMDYCLVVSGLTKDGLGQLFQSKHRRSEAKDPRVIRLIGALGRVYDANTTHVVDTATKTIVERSTVESVTEYKSGKDTAKELITAFGGNANVPFDPNSDLNLGNT